MKLYHWSIDVRREREEWQSVVIIPDDDEMIRTVRARLQMEYRFLRRQDVSARLARRAIFGTAFAMYLLLHPEKVRYGS